MDLIGHIGDIITTQPQPADLYMRLKNRLLASFSISSETRLHQLLKGEVIFDGKPSLLLNRLRNINDDNCSEEVIKAVFLDQLPAKLRGILALSNVDNVQALAQLADKIMEAMGPSEFNVTATTTLADPNQLNISAMTSTDRLDGMIERLAQRVDRLSREVSRPSRSLSRDRTGSSSHSRERHSRSCNEEMCFYHRKYVKKAQKCNQRCSWKPLPKEEN